jgi:opacity protein-like surface antigen
MLKKILVISSLLVACLSSTLMAADGPYLSANLGVTLTSDSDWDDGYYSGEFTFDPGFALGAALGYKFKEGRLEAEIGYKTAEIDEVTVDGYGSGSIDGDFSVFSIMANGYLDFTAAPSVKPYIMAGIGIANIEAELEGDEEDDSVFAYQVGVGLGLALNDRVTLDIGYRYMGTSDPDFEGLDTEYRSHNLLAGLRVQF